MPALPLDGAIRSLPIVRVLGELHENTTQCT